MSLILHSVLSKLYTEPYIGASYQVSAQRASGEISISLLTELSSLDKEFIIIIIIIWPHGFRGEYFLEIDQSETKIACGGHVC